MSVSKKVQQGMAEGSWIRRMFEEGARLKQQFGAENVFDLTLGNPVVEPPEQFRHELRRLADSPLPGMHRYMENAGYAGTRQAVAQELARETGLKFTASDVVMTCGAAGAMNVALKAMLNPADEVIVFSPYFVEYLNYVDNSGGVSRIVATDHSFMPRLGDLADAITAKTRAVIINSPNNPTGVVYAEELLAEMGSILRRKETEYGSEIFLLSDEPYRKLIYDGLKYPFPLHHHPRSIVVTSHSKDLALPGERIGYLAVNPAYNDREELISACIYCNRVLGFVNAPALMQNIVRSLQNVTVSIADYQRKRDFLYASLTEAGYSLAKPQGAFYMFPSSPIPDDVAFVRDLLEWKVLAVPGRGFGLPGYFRISYCVDDHTFEGAVAGLRQVIARYRQA